MIYNIRCYAQNITVKPEAAQPIIHSLKCKFDIKEAHGNKSYPFFEKNAHQHKHLWDVSLYRNRVSG